MTPEVLRDARSEAVATVDELSRQLSAVMAASADDNADDEHDPEGATIAFERAQLAGLLGAARARIRDLDAALERVSSGSYGVCTSCGGPIGSARLEARPATTVCVSCAR